MEQPIEIDKHNKSMNGIIGNISLMISDTCIGSGINPENISSGIIIWQPTINITMSSHKYVENN